MAAPSTPKTLSSYGKDLRWKVKQYFHKLCDQSRVLPEHVDKFVEDLMQVADTGRAEVQRHRRTQAARADHERARSQPAVLYRFADFVEQDVPRVTQQLRVVHQGARTEVADARAGPAP